MNILALESGADFWGLALAQIESSADDGLVRSLALAIGKEPRALARELFARVQSTLDLAQIELRDLDALAVGIGPGSWTGLRIGLTAMKTLAQTRRLPLAAVPSFDPLAQAVWRAKTRDENIAGALLLVAAPCRPGELYGKVYECTPDYLGIVQSEWIGSPQMLADTLGAESLSRGSSAPPILVGDGAKNVAEVLEASGEEYSVAEPSREQIMIELAIAGAAAVESGETADVMTLAPLYLAPSNAERNLLKV